MVGVAQFRRILVGPTENLSCRITKPPILSLFSWIPRPCFMDFQRLPGLRRRIPCHLCHSVFVKDCCWIDLGLIGIALGELVSRFSFRDRAVTV